MSAVPALLPCPFCGGPGRATPDGAGWPLVVCTRCGVYVEAINGADDPVRRWNRRPAPPGLEEAVEAARRMQRERFIGSQFIADARTVARALLALTRGDGREKPAARLLAASKEALRVLDEMSLDDLMEGKDALIRAELVAAIRDMEEGNGQG